MSENPDSGTHQRNGNGNGNCQPSPNPHYNNSLLYFDLVRGGSGVKSPFLCQI